MNFKLIRKVYGLSGIFGEFHQEDGTLFCKTLERAYPNDSGGFEPKIPVGVYTCVRRKSPHFGYDVFMLENVPGHDYVEIHIANWEKQLDGCIALGKDENSDTLFRSKDAFDAFMELQKNVDTFELQVMA